MKKLKKFAALLLAVAIALCGCGKKSGTDVTGTWGLDYDMGDMLRTAMGEDFKDFNGSLVIKFCFEFDKDGSFRTFIEESSFNQNFNGWKDDLVDYTVQKMYDEFAAQGQGMSAEEVEEAFMQQNGISMEEFKDIFRQTVDGMLDPDAMFESSTREGVYKMDGDKLYVAEDKDSYNPRDYVIVSVDGDSLKFSAPDGVQTQEILPGLGYPLTFKKIQ